MIALPVAAVISGVTMEVAFGIMNREWFDPRQFDFTLLKELLAIAIPLLPNFLIYWVFNSCDKVMVTNMIGIGAAGIYSVGSKLGHIDSNTIVRSGTQIGENSFVGANCIIGEYLMDFCINRTSGSHVLKIGNDALIRSGSIIYTDSEIGEGFQTGHQVTIREK